MRQPNRRLLDAARSVVSENGLRPWEEWRTGTDGKPEPKPPAFSVAVCGATGMRETNNGCCPVHGGDACLVGTRRLVEMLRAFVEAAE